MAFSEGKLEKLRPTREVMQEGNKAVPSREISITMRIVISCTQVTPFRATEAAALTGGFVVVPLIAVTAHVPSEPICSPILAILVRLAYKILAQAN